MAARKEREGYTDDGEEREVDVLDLRSLTRMLHAGILERLVSPPATPKGRGGDRQLTTLVVGWNAAACRAGPTHELGGHGGAHHGREVGRNEGHAALDILEHVLLGLVEGLQHVARLKHQVHLLLLHLLPAGGGEGAGLAAGGGNTSTRPHPWVVDAVTETTITVAAGRIS